MAGRKSAEARRVSRDAVVLVDEQDRPLGVEAKLKAHEAGGRLHRAFSVFLFDAAGRMLLQRRAAGKYHFGGLWTNACCSPPQWGEDVVSGARARLRGEVGGGADLAEAVTFVYPGAGPARGPTEHEFDHVLFGRFDGRPEPDPAEVDDWRWVDSADLARDVAEHPDRYTPWFRIALEQIRRRQNLIHEGARRGTKDGQKDEQKD